MKKYLKILSKLQWLGLIGLIGIFFEIKILEIFMLLWFFSLIEVFSYLRSVSDDLSFLAQNFGMLIGIPFIYIRYGFRLPNKVTYVPECQYSLPFEGTWLVANGGVDKNSSHSWGICTQRYAYDFLIVDENKETHADNRENLHNYYCYGKNVLAPADGIVVDLKDKFDNTPIVAIGKVDCTASDIRGNYIIIKHSKHEYSLIAHLLKDSICVKVGDKINQGQIVAKCGNSGNTSEPHIHFHVQSGKSFLFSAGLPIHFKDIEFLQTNITNSNFISNEDFVQNINPDSFK